MIYFLQLIIPYVVRIKCQNMLPVFIEFKPLVKTWTHCLRKVCGQITRDDIGN